MDINKLNLISKKVRHDIVEMVNKAGSGHMGGSLSSADIYLSLWNFANISPATTRHEDRDRIVISHGHTSAAVYSVLGNLGYFDINEAIASFRSDSIFEGHPSLKVNGVEWCSGSLGQGLSVACGFALGAKLKGLKSRVYVVMGDGEQAKGQLNEAREFAVKYNLDNLTAIVDYNCLQASGSMSQILPQNVEEKYRAVGWNTITIDGHDYKQIMDALSASCNAGRPTMILAKTVMGKGLPMIENNFEYHGKLLTKDELAVALEELKSDYPPIPPISLNPVAETYVEDKVNMGTPITYTSSTDCRSAFGNALNDIAQANQDNDVTLAALDCDLCESVKLQKLNQNYPACVIECGIAEHNAATVAAALSKMDILTFFADFGVFGVDETFSQHRMGDINHASIKLICTHNGLDVGEDGKTHQCVDYIGNMLNLFGFKILVPADANQADRITRYAATNHGNMVINMGRSKLPVITDENGKPFFGEDYTYEYGKADWLRKGSDATIITCGTMVGRAISAADQLKTEGISVGVLNISSPNAIDIEALAQAAATGFIVTYEDHSVYTGLGSVICSNMAENGLWARVKKLGITQYGGSAAPDIQFAKQGLDVDSLIKAIKDGIILK